MAVDEGHRCASTFYNAYNSSITSITKKYKTITLYITYNIYITLKYNYHWSYNSLVYEFMWWKLVKKLVKSGPKIGLKIVNFRVQNSLIFKVEKVAKNRQNLRFSGLLAVFWVNGWKKVEKKCKKMPRKMTFYPVFLTFPETNGGPETRILRF